ncbi:MAG TPA: hypothetical protein VKJ07_21510, partial [Mycobacteriales bacterium]|nr:hypothetical protein [Mycobacteriales bacterium]
TSKPASAFTPPPGSVLVSAATGGSVSAHGATLTFAPGALPADAWISITTHLGSAAGLYVTSVIYDLHAYDATTGALISTFNIAPRLQIAVGPLASASSIYYLDPANGPQLIASDSVGGAVTADLPHFSSYLAGTPLDGLAALVLPLLQQYVADALSTPRTVSPGSIDLGSFKLLNPSLTLSVSSGTYTVAISGQVVVDLALGARHLGATATISGSYSAASGSLGSGTFTVTLHDLTVNLADVVTVTAASAALTQAAGDGFTTVTATGVSATFGVPSGPSVALTGATLGLVLDTSTTTTKAAFALTGASVSVNGLPQVSLTGTGWSLAYNGGVTAPTSVTEPSTSTQINFPADGTLDVAGSGTLSVAGQSLGVTGLTVTRTTSGLSLAFTSASLTVSVAGQSVSITATSGTLSVDDSGVVGSLTGTITTTGSTFSASSSAHLDVNSRPVAATGLPAGPYLRITLTGAQLAIGSL